MLNPAIAIKTTARDLVRDRFGDRPLGRAAVREAIDQVLRRGWLSTFIPKPTEFDCSLVLLAQSHRFAALARCLGPDGRGVVPLGLIESRTGFPIDNIMTGIFLARHGLAMVGVSAGSVSLCGAPPSFASLINFSRRDLIQGYPCTRMVEYATGLRFRIQHLTDDLRLRVALVFEEFAVDVPGLLEGQAASDLVSRWTFPSPPQPPQDRPAVVGPKPPVPPMPANPPF